MVSCLKRAEEPRYLSDADWRAKDSNTCCSAPLPQSQASACSQVTLICPRSACGPSSSKHVAPPVCPHAGTRSQSQSSWKGSVGVFSADRCAKRRKTGQQKQRRKEGGEGRGGSAWPWVFWTEVSGPSLGEGVWPAGRRYWTNTNGTLSITGESHVWLRWKHWTRWHIALTHTTNPHTCQDTRGGRGNNESPLIKAGTSWHITHAYACLDLSVNKRSYQSQHTHRLLSANRGLKPRWGSATSFFFFLLIGFRNTGQSSSWNCLTQNHRKDFKKVSGSQMMTDVRRNCSARV